ncbi:MAG: transposase [Holosporaceae bacterium]|jgi:transposase-like protein|nr:transposase [Holosporaceae bacterium]
MNFRKSFKENYQHCSAPPIIVPTESKRLVKIYRMKKGKHEMQKAMKAEDIVVLLRKVEILINQGKTVKLSCREAGISEYSYRRWRKEYGGLDISKAKELKRLKEENSRLKRAVADLTLDKLVLNDALSGVERILREEGLRVPKK